MWSFDEYHLALCVGIYHVLLEDECISSSARRDIMLARDMNWDKRKDEVERIIGSYYLCQEFIRIHFAFLMKDLGYNHENIIQRPDLFYETFTGKLVVTTELSDTWYLVEAFRAFVKGIGTTTPTKKMQESARMEAQLILNNSQLTEAIKFCIIEHLAQDNYIEELQRTIRIVDSYRSFHGHVRPVVNLIIIMQSVIGETNRLVSEYLISLYQ